MAEQWTIAEVEKKINNLDKEYSTKMNGGPMRTLLFTKIKALEIKTLKDLLTALKAEVAKSE
mgnify:CR=1 FL=1